MIPYPKTNWINDTTPLSASNMNNLERGVYQNRGVFFDPMYFYRMNMIPIASCDSDEGWANNSWDGNVGTYAADTTNVKVGNAGASLSGGTAQNTGIHLVKALDLSTYEDGTTVDASGNDAAHICFMLYITAANIAKIGSLEFALCYNAYDTYTQYRYFRIATSGLVDGWNAVKIQLSSFSSVGGPTNWSSITGIDIHAFGTPSAALTFTIDCMFLCKCDPLSQLPNPFQVPIDGVWTRQFEISETTDFWYIGLDGTELVCRNLNSLRANVDHRVNLIGNMIYRDYFAVYAEAKCLQTDGGTGNGRGISVGIYCDSNEYVVARYTDGGLSIVGMHNLSPSFTVFAGTETLNFGVGDIIRVMLIKCGKTYTAMAMKNNSIDTAVYVQLTNNEYWPSSNDWKLMLACDSGYTSNILSAGITSTEKSISSMQSDFALDVKNSWRAWNPTLSWTTGTPGTITTIARYMRIGNTCFFNISISSADGNGATQLSIPTPITPRDNNSIIAFQSYQKVNATYTNPLAYLDDDSGGITFRNFSVATDNQALEIVVSGQYEI